MNGTAVGARQVGLNISELLIYWDFPRQPCLEFTRIGLRKRIYPASSSSQGESVSVMPEEHVKLPERQK